MATVYTKERFKEIKVSVEEYVGEAEDLVCVISKEEYDDFNLMNEAAHYQQEEMLNSMRSQTQIYSQAISNALSDDLVKEVPKEIVEMKMYAMKLSAERKAKVFQFADIDHHLPILYKQSDIDRGESTALVMLAITNDGQTAIRFEQEQPNSF